MPEPPGPRADVAEKQRGLTTPAPAVRRSLAEIVIDPRYKDPAVRLAQYLDGRCYGPDKWCTWRLNRTIARDLGWDTTATGGRKKVQRVAGKLIEGGDLIRVTLGELVEWFEAEGKALGLAWPKGLPKALRMKAEVYVLGWRIPAPGSAPAEVGECDKSVAHRQDGQDGGPPVVSSCAPDVAHPATEVSHSTATEMSHPLKVRNLESENRKGTSDDDVSACAPQEDQEPPMTAAWTPRELAAREVRRLRDRGVILRAEGELLVPELIHPSVEPPTESEKATLKSMRGEVLAYLRGDPVPRPGPSGSASPGYAAPVDPGRMAEFEAMAANLPRNTDPGSARAAAAALGSALGDPKPESMETWEGYCHAVRSGRMEASDLIRAFRRACSPKARDRGRLMVNSVQRLRAMAGAGVPRG